MTRRRRQPLLSLFVCAACLGSLSAYAQDASDYRLKVDVKLVLVPTVVISESGQPVPDLDRDAFEIRENGEPQTLVLFERHTGLPLQLVLMIDTSLSTTNALRRQQEAASGFIRQVLRPQDAAALYEFSGKVDRRVGFTSDFAALEKGLLKLKVQAGTSLYDAIIKVADDLKKREGRRVLVIVSDGMDTTSQRDFHAALRAAQEAEVGIFPLVTRPIPGETGRNLRGEHVLIALAEMTGGQTFFPASDTDLDQSFRTLSGLLRTQYLLGYRPTGHTLREDFHRIEVRVSGGDYLVRHRKGYWHRSE